MKMRFGPPMPVETVNGMATRARSYTGPDTSTYVEHEQPRDPSRSVALWRALFAELDAEVRSPVRRSLLARLPKRRFR